MEPRNIIILVFIIIIIVVLNALLINKIFYEKEINAPSEATETYNPQINPGDFSTNINNKYLTFTPGMTYIYEGETEEGTERIEVYATNNIKRIMGVNVLEVSDRVWLEDELIEDTKDWFAQDKHGNVWYFGEDSKEIVNGKIASTRGSWVAGFYGAKPGIVMEANPKVKDTYRQEYFPGVAEDMAEVIALGVIVKVKYGSFSNCLQTRDWNPLEPGNDEYKYYCPEAGGLVYETGIESGEGVQLIAIENLKKQPAKIDEPAEELKKAITEEDAVSIARKEVAGEVTDVGIEKKFGRAAYVVEINANGKETDVVIDIETGEVLGIET